MALEKKNTASNKKSTSRQEPKKTPANKKQTAAAKKKLSMSRGKLRVCMQEFTLPCKVLINFSYFFLKIITKTNEATLYLAKLVKPC